MPKRTFWTTVGYGAGLASSVMVQRRVKRAVKRVAPAEVREVVERRGLHIVGRARNAGGTVVGAVREGRTAMRETEQELRRDHAPTKLRRAR